MESYNKHWKYKSFPYSISYPELFHGKHQKTHTPWSIITINKKLYSTHHKKEVTVEFFKDSGHKYMLVIDGQLHGAYDKPGTLTYFFTEEEALRLVHTVHEGSAEISYKEQLKVYVSKLWLDDPNFKKLREADNAYWSGNGTKFEIWLDNNAATTVAFYAIKKQSDGTELHTKLRISNIKTKSYNVDESHIVINPETGEAISPEQYVKTWNMKKEELAHWLVYTWHIRQTDTQPTSVHFK